MLQCQEVPYVASELGNEPFKTLLNKIAERFPSRTALAKALKITPSRLSRALNTGDFPFNIENCLRLAQVSEEPPSDVLRAADNREIAELIESLYGPEKRVTDPVLQDLLQEWPTLTLENKNVVRMNVSIALRLHRTGADDKPVQVAEPRHGAGRKRGR
ncbi:MAG: hypothetical protein ABJA98_01490 [Acidobacteriota bacterium]